MQSQIERRNSPWPALSAAAALALAAVAAGCAQSAPRPAASSMDCLIGPDADRPECASLDDEPEQCAIAGGIFDATTGRCIR